MACNGIIGRKYSLLVGKESTAGTEASTFTSVPLTAAPFVKPIVEKVQNESGIGRIEGVSDSYITKKMTETNIEGQAGQLTFGHILTAAFGASAAPTLIETLVYKHSFVVQNDNAHQSYSLVEDGRSNQELSLYNMLDTLSLSMSVGDIVRFNGLFKGKDMNGTTGKTVSFVAEQPFKISNMVVKFAANVAGLAGASAIATRAVNVEFGKNIIDITESGSVVPNCFLNQQLSVTGDMELTYNDDTYRDTFIAGTKQAMSILIQGDSLIGATQKAELYFEFPSLDLEEWDRSTGNNEILTETFGFSSEYSISDTAMVTGYLQNTQSTQY